MAAKARPRAPQRPARQRSLRCSTGDAATLPRGSAGPRQRRRVRSQQSSLARPSPPRDSPKCAPVLAAPSHALAELENFPNRPIWDNGCEATRHPDRARGGYRCSVSGGREGGGGEALPAAYYSGLAGPRHLARHTTADSPGLALSAAPPSASSFLNFPKQVHKAIVSCLYRHGGAQRLPQHG
jgi:hypothetical protein